MNQMKGFHRPFGGNKVVKETKHSVMMRTDHKIEGGPIQKKPEELKQLSITKQPARFGTEMKINKLQDVTPPLTER
jgi:hypothetical protein